MDNYQFIPSVLETRASASLEAEVAKELLFKDPEKTIAQLLQTNNEEETQPDQKEKDQKSQEDQSI